MKNGYIYIANKKKYLCEAIISSRSLKDHSSFPICLITIDELVSQESKNNLKHFDLIIKLDGLENRKYDSKIIGIPNTPFEYTVFLDTDTFVCANIDDVFCLLDQFDIACTLEPSLHTSPYPEDKEGILYKNVFPELNTGVIAFKKNSNTKTLFENWKIEYSKLKTYFDMPSFREAVLRTPDLKFCILPNEYNQHGLNSMHEIRNQVRIIHARLGERLNTLTPVFESYEKMRKRAEKINANKQKRIYIPYLGIIPATWNLKYIKYKIKKRFGVKNTSKGNTF